MSEPAPQLEGRLVVVDLQHVFGDEGSPWTAPRFVPPEQPVGAWKEYYEQYDFARRPAAVPLYHLGEDPGAHEVVDATTFGTWGPDLAEVVGDGPLTVAGVATDCCVLSTVLPAADAGVAVRVVGDVCAGSCDEDHDSALRLMGLCGPLVEITTTDEVLAGR